jgi:dipeptidyl aminopeptidase/acylaminoacyl peptidase
MRMFWRTPSWQDVVTFLVGMMLVSDVGIASLASAESHFPSNEDLRHVRAMTEPQVSPDGRRVLVQISDSTADGAHSHLWLVDITPNTARQLTWTPATDKVGERIGRWMPDGDSVLFLAKRGEQTQLYRLPMAGGEARVYDLKIAPVVDTSSEADALPPKTRDDPPVQHDPLPIDIDSYEASPNGRSIAIVASDPQTPGEKNQRDKKADATWRDHDLHGKRLYLLDPESGKLTPVAVPPDVASVAWSKRSDRLVAISQGPNHAEDLAPANNAWMVSVSDPGHPSQMKELPATAFGGAWSEDDKRYYFMAQSEEDAPPSYADLYVLTLADRSVVNLTAHIEGSISGQELISTGTGVIAPMQVGTRRGYVAFQAGKRATIGFESPVVAELHCNSKKTEWVWLGTSGMQPTTLYVSASLGRKALLLSTPALLPIGWTSILAREVHWKNDGRIIEGLLYLPPQVTNRKAPLVVFVHGGPTDTWLNSFDPLTDFLLAQGWAVLKPNPRGSTGYSAAFAAANKNDLGDGDYRDIMTGVDAAIAEYPIDADRLALIGYSYGGEMAGFVEGKTDRFKAIVSGAPVINQASEYGTEGISYYDRWFYGKPWEHPTDAWRQSPLAYVAHATTPFLLLHGENDTSDPLGQSLEMYRALRQVGVQVQMVQYPREDHGPLAAAIWGAPSAEPWHGFDARQRLVKFIKTAFEKASNGS